MVEVTEVESGLGQEAIDKAGPVLHPGEPGLHQRGQLIDVLLVRSTSDLVLRAGLCASEACSLRLGDVDAGRSLRIVRGGKFDKSRLVPHGPRTAALVN